MGIQIQLMVVVVQLSALLEVKAVMVVTVDLMGRILAAATAATAAMVRPLSQLLPQPHPVLTHLLSLMLVMVVLVVMVVQVV